VKAVLKGFFFQIRSLLLTISVISFFAKVLSAYTLTADRSVAEKEKIFLYGNVRLFTDDYKTEADSAVFMRKDSIVIIPGEMIVFKGDSIETKGSSGEYDIRKKIFTIEEQATEKAGSFRVTSGLLTIFHEESLMVFKNGCIAFVDGGSKKIISDTLVYNTETSNLKCFNSIVMTDSSASYSIKSDTFNMKTSDSIYDFYHNVEFKNDSIQMNADSAAFLTDKNIFRTYSKSIILSENSKITGDSVFAFMKKDSIDYISIYGNIEFSHWDSKKSENIVCDSMNLDILEGGFSKAVMFGIKKAELILKEKDTDADKN